MTNHRAGADKMVPAAFVCGLLAGLILGVAGCASMVKRTDTRPMPPSSPSTEPSSTSSEDVQAMVSAIVKAEIEAAVNLNTGPITGVNYQSVLPMGMVVLLTVIVLSGTAANSFEDLLLHRQQMAKLKNGAK